MPAHKIGFFLNATPNLGPLFKQAEYLIALQQAYVTIAPAQLAKSSQVVLLTDGKLKLSAENGAIAAKLKQIAPSFIEQFVRRGFEVTAIQIEVQVANSLPLHKKKPLTIGPQGLTSLTDLAKTLPDSDLKRALQEIAARHKKPG